MIKAKGNLTLDIIAAVILYAAVIIYQGYQYGQSDQSQILPVLFAQDHPGSYQKDHYVNAYLQSGINERTIFQFILRYSGYDIPWLVFLWHALFSLSLIVAWIRIAGIYISNKSLQFACVGCILILGFHTSVGSNEIYYNQFIPSLPAKAIASWGSYYWLNNKFGTWALLLILSTLLQPLVGLQLFTITAIAQLIGFLKNRRKEKLPLEAMILYLIVIVPWIILLATNNGGRDHPSAFMDIMEFRLSHHFFGSYFGFFHLLLFFLFTILCVFSYKGKLKWFALLIIAGCGLYEIGVEFFRSPLFLYTQWWKTTIWIEALGIVALVGFLETGFYLKEKFRAYPLLIPIVILFLISIYRLTGISGPIPVYMSPFPVQQNDHVEIALEAKRITNDGAVFIVPPELSAFRWYSKRNTFVDHKALFHQEDFLMEWYNRIQLVFHYDLSQKRSGISFEKRAGELLSHPDNKVVSEWKALGITHIISPNPDLQGFTLLGSNPSYSIYKL